MTEHLRPEGVSSPVGFVSQADHDRRVTELLTANNLLVARARAAEARIGIVEDGEPMTVERALTINGAICYRYFAAELGAFDKSPPDALRGVTLSQMLIARAITEAVNEQAPSIDGKKTIHTVVAQDRFIAAVCVLESYPATSRAICTDPAGTKAVAVASLEAAKTRRVR